MKINFKMDGKYCLTQCPWGSGFKVNSVTCRTVCSYFKKVDKENKILFCKCIKKWDK
jgi:hypothetical protein